MLMQCLGIPHISTGDMLRDQIVGWRRVGPGGGKEDGGGVPGIG